MPVREMDDDQIKAEILNKLYRRGCWGKRYFPVDTLVNWMGKQVKDDGKKIRRVINKLRQQGLVQLHKGGKTISLNPNRMREIFEFIDSYLK